MKVSLVVASGAHEGRVIPLPGPQFLIGRDQQCNLRPASPAISKMHCAILVRGGQVLVQDFGSTNGTMVNGQLVQATEVPIDDGASLQVGPLDFTVRIEPAPVADGTPLPGNSPEAAAALAAVKAATAGPKAVARDATPAPAKPAGSKPGVKPAPAKSDDTPADDENDRVAAMLLGMDDDGNGSVPDGSTVMEMPNPLAGTTPGGEPKKDDSKPGEPKKAQTREEMSSAANDLLRKYMRRPK